MTEPRFSIPRCANRQTWQNLLDERIDEAERPALLGHLDDCPACAQTVAELAAEWSLATLTEFRTNEGHATRALRERITGVHALPPPPLIPDLADLVFAGRGGMGAVYRGRDTRLNRLIAVKVLAGSGAFSATARARHEREAQQVAGSGVVHLKPQRPQVQTLSHRRPRGQPQRRGVVVRQGHPRPGSLALLLLLQVCHVGVPVLLGRRGGQQQLKRSLPSLP